MNTKTSSEKQASGIKLESVVILSVEKSNKITIMTISIMLRNMKERFGMLVLSTSPEITSSITNHAQTNLRLKVGFWHSWVITIRTSGLTNIVFF